MVCLNKEREGARRGRIRASLLGLCSTQTGIPEPGAPLRRRGRERASGIHRGGSASLARAAACGPGHQTLSSSLPARPRSCLTCAAWSLLRDCWTPAPCGGEEHLSVSLARNPLVHGSTTGGGSGSLGFLGDQGFEEAGDALLAAFGQTVRCVCGGTSADISHEDACPAGGSFDLFARP
jgi:hypothetical protein